MYSNIGGKIKVLAVVLAAIGTAVSVFIGIDLMSANTGYHDAFSSSMGGIGAVVLFGGPLLSWVSSFVLYGFGQLVENSDFLVRHAKFDEAKNKQESNAESAGPEDEQPAPATNARKEADRVPCGKIEVTFLNQIHEKTFCVIIDGVPYRIDNPVASTTQTAKIPQGRHTFCVGNGENAYRTEPIPFVLGAGETVGFSVKNTTFKYVVERTR